MQQKNATVFHLAMLFICNLTAVIRIPSLRMINIRNFVANHELLP